MVKIKHKNNKPDVASTKTENDSPVFCFKYLQDNSLKNCQNTERLISFFQRCRKLGQLGWKEINKSHRHSFGTEKIPIKGLKPQLDNIPIITPEIKELTVFRYTGDNRPFLGIRRENVFHVIFIEIDFNDIYNH